MRLDSIKTHIEHETKRQLFVFKTRQYRMIVKPETGSPRFRRQFYVDNFICI
jgi:hypothetical protein